MSHVTCSKNRTAAHARVAGAGSNWTAVSPIALNLYTHAMILSNKSRRTIVLPPKLTFHRFTRQRVFFNSASRSSAVNTSAFSSLALIRQLLSFGLSPLNASCHSSIIRSQTCSERGCRSEVNQSACLFCRGLRQHFNAGDRALSIWSFSSDIAGIDSQKVFQKRHHKVA